MVIVAFYVAYQKELNVGIQVPLSLQVMYYAVIAAIELKLIGWFVSNVEFSAGPPLSFTGTYQVLLGWDLLLFLSAFTIIGWAWASTGVYRWVARNTQGEGIQFRFHGQGHQILWRTLVFALVSVLIIPIPWIALWLIRWHVQNISFTRSADASVVA